MNGARPPEDPWVDPIVAEVRKVRADLLAAPGFDLERLAQLLRDRQAASRLPRRDAPSAQAGAAIRRSGTGEYRCPGVRQRSLGR